MKREKKKLGRVATTADTNYCGPWLKRKTKIVKTMYKIKNSKGYGRWDCEMTYSKDRYISKSVGFLGRKQIRERLGNIYRVAI